MEPATTPVLDPDTIAGLQRAQADLGDRLLIRQLVEIYRTNAPRRIEQLRKAIAGSDAKTLGFVAHTLKTNCAMLGATAMAAMCATLERFGDAAVLEQRGEKATFEDAAALFAGLELEFERVLAALAQLLEGEPTNT